MINPLRSTTAFSCLNIYEIEKYSKEAPEECYNYWLTVYQWGLFML